MYDVGWRVVDEKGEETVTHQEKFDTLRALWKYVKKQYPKAVIWGPHMKVPFARPYSRDIEAATKARGGLLVWPTRKSWDSDSIDTNYAKAVAWITDEFAEEPEEDEE